MRIGFDATTFHLTKGGTSVYLSNILLSLKKLYPNSDFNTFCYGRDYSMNIGGIQKKIETIYRELIWQQFIFPKKARAENMQVIHSPNHIAPLKSTLPRVVTFHDIYIIKNPKAFKNWQSKYAQMIVPKVLNSGCIIISVSEFTKNEIMERFNIPSNKITVVPNGVGDEYKIINCSKKLNIIKKKYNLPDHYMLYVGAIEPRKNLSTLLKALKILLDKVQIKLVIASSGGWKNQEDLELLNSYKIKDYVKNLGYVANRDLPALYNLATLFIYPSIYEGFGLPVLEAMSCGCPVISANGSSLSEVIKDAGLLFDPMNPEQLANQINSILTSSSLYSYIREKGFERSRQFSWEKCAQQTFEVYRSLT